MVNEAKPPVGRASIRVLAQPSGVDVRLTGDLDSDTGVLLADAILAAAESIGPSQRVDVDLRAVERLTPAGLHVLATCTSDAKARHRGIRVRFNQNVAAGLQATSA